MVPQDRKDDMLEAMEKAGVQCSIVGRIEEESFGIMRTSQQGTFEIEPPYADEIYKVVGK